MSDPRANVSTIPKLNDFMHYWPLFQCRSDSRCNDPRLHVCPEVDVSEGHFINYRPIEIAARVPWESADGTGGGFMYSLHRHTRHGKKQSITGGYEEDVASQDDHKIHIVLKLWNLIKHCPRVKGLLS